MVAQVKPRIRVKLLSDRFAEIHLTPRCCYITRCLKRPGKNGRLARVQSAYFGFDSEAEAQAFARSFNYSHRAVCRPAERLGTAWEVKLNNVTEVHLERLVKRVEKPAPSPNYAGFRVNDVVEINSDRFPTLTWKTGTVKVLGNSGCTVDVGGTLYHLQNSEIQPLKNSLIQETPEQRDIRIASENAALLERMGKSVFDPRYQQRNVRLPMSFVHRW